MRVIDQPTAEGPRFTALPAVAAFTHVVARDGFEVVFMREGKGGALLEGHVSAVEEGIPRTVRWELETDAHWRTRRAHAIGRTPERVWEVTVEGDGDGHWLADGGPPPPLGGR